jgi:hypothetical protein
MSKIETKTGQYNEYLHTLREDYSKRIDEVDAFYKRMSNMGVEVNTEFLYGCLDVAQHYLDLQQEYSIQYPWLYPSELLRKVIKQNTQAWIQTIQNMDSLGTDGMKNIKNNLRTLNKNTVQSIRNAEKIADTCRNLQSNTIESAIPVTQKLPRSISQKESNPP